MTKKDGSSLRGALEVLKEKNELKTISKEIDPIYEISGLLKSLDEGPALLFENIKGYPGVRDVGNLLCTREKISQIFNLEVGNPKELLQWGRRGLMKPTAPRVIERAPCQEAVITENIDILETLPVLKHTEADVGRIIGSGNYLISVKYFEDGK